MNEQVLNIQFVQEVKKHPCLYNYNLTEYSRRDVTDKAWSEVGKIINLTGSQCKERWKNLRAVFVRHMKIAKSGSSAKKKRPYYLTDAMQFTVPFIRILSGVSVNLPDAYQEEIIEQEDNEELDAPYLPLSSIEHDLPTTFSLPNLPCSPKSYSCPPQKPVPQNDDSRTIKYKHSKALDKTVMDYFNAKKVRMENKADDVTDSRKMFLLSLLHDINSMSDIQMRTFRRKVLALIDEILE